jgi:DNA polymerase-3 subunit epsilon
MGPGVGRLALGGLRATAYAVVDVETTGLDPAVDRIVEVAVVRTDAGGRITHEYATTVDPGSPVLLTEIHGLDEVAVRGSPSFAAAGAAIAARLTGAVVVGHNVAFDLAFLRAEFARSRSAMPILPGLCTLTLAGRLGRRPDGWNLAACCAEAGVVPDQAHTALGDARSAARLLAAYLEAAKLMGLDTLAGLGCDPLLLPPAHWRTGIAFSSRQQRRPDTAASV